MKLRLSKPLKIILIIILVIATILLHLGLRPFIRGIVAVPILFWGFFWCSILTPPPPPPQIEYAEFPIRLVYEINGTECEIKETFICQYDGWDTSGDGLSKVRTWKFINGDGSSYFTIYDDGETEIYCEYLSAAAYMGDKKYSYDYNPKLDIYATTDQSSHRTMSTKELSEEFGITKIRFYPPACVENSFSYLNYFR